MYTNEPNPTGYPYSSGSLLDDDALLALLQQSTKPARILDSTTSTHFFDSLPSALDSTPTSAPLVSPLDDADTADSSPSPPITVQPASLQNPSINTLNSSMASRATRSGNRDGFTAEPAQKRKVLDDLDEESDDDEPQRKVQHTDSSTKKSATKRKSISGQDESRLQKRKEQNRAAQRAFRERKERHVKDLEDKVAMLEEKTDSQAAENENLRELLTRLQQENLQLKQNQFSFTFHQPFGSTSANASTSTAQQGYRPTTHASSDSSLAAPKVSPPSTSTSPASDMGGLTRMLSNGSNGNLASARPKPATPQLTNNVSPPSELNLLDPFTLGGGATPDLNFSTMTNTTGGAGPLAGLTPPATSSFSLMDASFFESTTGTSSTMDFGSLGDAPLFQFMPYQTIAANPQYTSYRDPAANPNAWSFGPNSSQGASLSTYDELFGGAGPSSGTTTFPPANNASSLEDSNMQGSLDDLNFSFIPDLSNTGSQFGGISPISHLPTPPSATSTLQQGPGSSTSTSGQNVTTPASGPQDHSMAGPVMHDGKSCPKTKEDIEDAIQKSGLSMFGPQETPVQSIPMADPASTVCTTMAKADSTKLNLDIGTAWRAVRQHPQFEECDIDELCAELARKATCDGTNKVIEAQQIMDIVHSIPERAKQRKLSLISKPVA